MSVSKRVDITADDGWFCGERKTFVFEVLDAADLPIDVAGYSFAWALRHTQSDTGAALISKATGIGGGIAITGTYNPARATNTQRVEVTVDPTDTWTNDTTHLTPKVYAHSLARTDVPGVILFGQAELLVATTLR